MLNAIFFSFLIDSSSRSGCFLLKYVLGAAMWVHVFITDTLLQVTITFCLDCHPIWSLCFHLPSHQTKSHPQGSQSNHLVRTQHSLSASSEIQTKSPHRISLFSTSSTSQSTTLPLLLSLASGHISLEDPSSGYLHALSLYFLQIWTQVPSDQKSPSTPLNLTQAHIHFYPLTLVFLFIVFIITGQNTYLLVYCFTEYKCCKTKNLTFQFPTASSECSAWQALREYSLSEVKCLYKSHGHSRAKSKNPQIVYFLGIYYFFSQKWFYFVVVNYIYLFFEKMRINQKNKRKLPLIWVWGSLCNTWCLKNFVSQGRGV